MSGQRYFLSAALFALSAGSAAAQTGGEVEGVVVTGSRAAPRAATQSSAPVDAFSGDTLRATGQGDLARALQMLEPSLNFAGAVNAGGAANARGPTLRGLGQDQVLVLINGKRRHASSLINFNNTVGRGQVPVDLNLIPTAAIERVEVLRDGAAAQYGSDAIAGVINIILKDAAHGGMASAQGGVTEEGDGEEGVLRGSVGLPLGPEGALTLSGEVRRLWPMNRAEVDSRFGRVTNQQGEDGRTDASFAASARLPLAGGWEAYGDALAAWRRSHNTLQYRMPSVAPTLFPDGFLPRANVKLRDFGGTVGLRGDGAGWRIDLSDTFGFDRADYTVTDTANTSLGAASPTRFDAGGARYVQNLVNLSASRTFDLAAGANLAFGLEHRHERYRLRSGEAASFVGAGAQGFPGFNPPSPVDVRRDALSLYADGEFSLIRAVRIGAAVRHEDYDGAGSKTTGKASLFVRPMAALALRATASTGFRAPSLQQSYFSTVTSQNTGGVLVNVGTFAVTDPVARALGASDLRPETSRNYSAGLVWTPHPELTVTLDWFRVEIDDRIALSETLQGAAVTAILRARGITNASQARFFTNVADTRTEGFDVLAEWRRRFSNGQSLTLSLGYDVADTDIVRLRANPVLPGLPLLALSSIDLLAKAQRKTKLNAAAAWSTGRVTLRGQATRFGSFRLAPVTAEQTFGPETVVDLSADVALTDKISLGAGVLNLTDAYADKVAERALNQGGSLAYPEAGGLGFEGRKYYLRLTAAF